MITLGLLFAGILLSAIGFGFMYGAAGFFTFAGLLMVLAAALRTWKGL